MKLHAWGLSDVGRSRDHNEDTYLRALDRGLFAVADGMGGHLGGDRASHMAVEILEREVARALKNGLSQGRNSTMPPGAEPSTLIKTDELPAPAALLRDATCKASSAIYDLAQTDAELQGMGTTLTSLFVQGERAFLGHVGDSRAYLYRDGTARQLTEDHSWIAEQVRAGLLSADEARDSKFKHIITRSVGFERDVQVDLHQLPIVLGDCFLLCSDGLSNYLETEELARVLTAHYYRRVPSVLVELANDRGGEDNITVVLVYAANET